MSGAAFYRGHVQGMVVGGTGRFEGASGTVESDFLGHDLPGPLVVGEELRPTYGWFYGTIKGNLTFAD